MKKKTKEKSSGLVAVVAEFVDSRDKAQKDAERRTELVREIESYKDLAKIEPYGASRELAVMLDATRVAVIEFSSCNRGMEEVRVLPLHK